MSGTDPKKIRSPSKAICRGNMRIAIAGTGGLAWWIAHHIHEETGHQLLWLSRSAKPHLSAAGYQVMAVDYDSRRSLEFALRGIDVVISIIPGVIQCKIVDAAIRAGVKRFVPAEFEGLPGRRTANSVDRSLDRGKTAVLQHLQARQAQINSTVFVCGVFYERFAPGGLAQYNMGKASPYAREGDYMVNLREMTAQVPYSNTAGQQVFLCMTSASDVARFIVKALDIQAPWPAELTMCGERMSCYELLTTVARVRGRSFDNQSVVYHNPQTLRDLLAQFSRSSPEHLNKAKELIATQEGRYDYSRADLNAMYPGLQTQSFEQWLRGSWTGG